MYASSRECTTDWVHKPKRLEILKIHKKKVLFVLQDKWTHNRIMLL